MFLLKKSIQSIKESCEQDIFFKRGVVAVGIGKKSVKGIETDEDCVIVFVSKKLPETALLAEDKIPKRVGGMFGCKTDVIDLKGEIKLTNVHRQRIRPVRGGSSCVWYKGSACTAGAKVWVGKQAYVLGNCHCYFPHYLGAKKDDFVLQPSLLDGGKNPADIIGTADQVIEIKPQPAFNLVDAALVKVSDNDVSREQIGLGQMGTKIVRAKVGDIVVKSSRCFTKDTLLLTNPSGVKTIEEIKIGDKVYCLDENKNSIVSNPINNIFYQGKRNVYELKTRNRTIKVTDNHPFLTAERKEIKVLKKVIGKGKNQFTSWENNYLRRYKEIKWELKWKELKDIKRGDLILVLKKITNYDLSIGKELARFLGFWIGDGSAFYESREGGRVNLYCANKEEAERYGNLMKKLFEKNLTTYKRKNCWIVAMYSSEVAKRMLNYCSGKKLNKRIPEIIWKLPIEERIEFIEGYCDADGHRYNHYSKSKTRVYNFHTTNETLIKQVRELCIFSGMRVTNLYSIEKTGYKMGKAFYFKAYPDIKLNKKKFGYIKGFGQYSNIKSLQIPEGLVLQKIVSIKYVGIEDTFDIEVQNSHNFFANGILAHNTSGVGEGRVIATDVISKVRFQWKGEDGKIIQRIIHFKDQVFLSQNPVFVRGGDSSSIVFLKKDKSPCGMIFAGAEEVGVMNQMDNVQRLLNFSFEPEKEPLIGYVCLERKWLTDKKILINGLNFRNEPRIADNVIRRLNKGEEIEIIEYAGFMNSHHWVKIKTF